MKSIAGPNAETFSKLRGEQHKQHRQLQQKANAKLSGDTFDAKHLDKFLQTEYGEKGVYPVPITPVETKGLTVSTGKQVLGDRYLESQQKMNPAQTNIR